MAAEEVRQQGHQRKYEDRRECEAEVEEEQNRAGDDQGQHVAHRRGQTIRDELLECLDIVRQTRDQDAGALSLEVAHREALHVREEVAAQVGQDALADPARQVRLRAPQADADDADQHHGAGDKGEQARVARDDR